MSQCSRILEVLRDHRIHDMREIHQRAGTMRLNSRIAELRSRGHNIVCFKTGGVYRYQMLSELDAERAGPADSNRPSPVSGSENTGTVRARDVAVMDLVFDATESADGDPGTPSRGLSPLLDSPALPDPAGRGVLAGPDALSPDITECPAQLILEAA